MGSDWYRREAAAVVAALGSDPDRGLTVAEAAARFRDGGANELAARPRETLGRKFLRQFMDFLVLILVAASLLSAFVGESTDAAVILVIVFLNAALGVVQESKAEKALDALKKMAAPTAKVVREGGVAVVAARELVAGDIVLLEAGDFVPADLRIIQAFNLKIEEASLTGESVPVEKSAAALAGEAALADRHNLAFMSTTVTYGRGRGIVIATGMGTEIGKIAQMLSSTDEDATPLQKELARFGKLLGLLCLAVCAVIFALGIFHGYRDGTLTLAELQLLLMTAVSLAVAAIPEGLPAIVTVVLALGMQRMAKKHALVRRLHAVETLGSTTVICSDKTGTLTQNQMTVREIFAGGKVFAVSGEGYNPEGEFLLAGRPVDSGSETELGLLLRGAVLCSDARLKEGEGVFTIVGDPTEGALVVAAAKGGYGQQEMSGAYPRLQEIPFDADRKLMTTFHADGGKVVAFVKGAPDILLAKADKIFAEGRVREMAEADAAAVREALGAMADRALRVLAVACREFDGLPADLSPDAIERGLVFIGLLGMIDPPRAEAREAVKTCNSAGIRPIMITGDQAATALAVARDLGIAAAGGEVVTGARIDAMAPGELDRVVRTASVFARVSPAHKVAIVAALRGHGEIVAMTGDGVNDAPALKRADIGVAMGITGTDVTKETADMVLTDDNFASIVAAVEEGRVIFTNIRKCVFFLLSCNLAEIMIIFFAMLLGWPIPLLPIHLLWLNLVTDAFPAFALGMEKREPDVMRVAPRDPREPIINRSLRRMIALQSGVMTVAVLGAFYYALASGLDLAVARTVAFATLIASELLRSLSARSERHSVFAIGVFSNRYMNAGIAASFALLLLALYSPLSVVLKTACIGAGEWALIASFGLLPFLAGEACKRLSGGPGGVGKN